LGNVDASSSQRCEGRRRLSHPGAPSIKTQHSGVWIDDFGAGFTKVRMLRELSPTVRLGHALG